MIKSFSPTHWQEYALLDCGRFEKLERFGPYVLIRPEPQAVWDKAWPDAKWDSMAHARFVPYNSSSGNWQKMKPMPDDWTITYHSPTMKLKFKLALTAFKHVGLFPEQADNWEFIHHQVKQIRNQQQDPPKILNLFAYTGGASLAAKSAGADVVHLDSVRQVVSWAKGNMELSGQQDIRWLVEDARKFVERELRRGRIYQGIMADPPAYGLGPSGERWKLEDHFNELVKNLVQLLDPRQSFLVLNTYSLGFSSLIVDNFLRTLLPDAHHHHGELYLKAESGLVLPLGVIGRKSAFGA